jgi:hypothetical protein
MLILKKSLSRHYLLYSHNQKKVSHIEYEKLKIKIDYIK